MSIQGEINRITQNVSDTYSVLNDLGATMPAEANSDALAETAGSVSAVLYGKAQSLTDEQKAQARENIGVEGAVSEFLSMTASEYEALTTAEKTALYAEGVRAIAVDDGVDMDSLTDQQKFANFAFPVGSCYTTTTNNNPANILGIGTWTLIDKLFSEKRISSGAFTYNTTNASAATERIIRTGHNIRINLNITTAVALNDTTYDLGTLSFSTIGISNIWVDQWTVGTSDGGNGVSQAVLLTSSGVLSHRDCVTKASNGSLTSGQKVLYDFVIAVDKTRMLDSACDQFIWKRTA